ncbi:hypothetical protein EC973_009191, partial [Apophysomyces ossiformis]
SNGSSTADSIHAPAKKLSYAKTVAKNIAPQKPRKLKVTLETIQRTLTAPSGPSQYTFVYLSCRHHLRHSQVRQFLGVLKVQQSRIIDIQFPARGTIALLVHTDYKNELIGLLTQNKVPVKPAFDPTNAEILGDPKLASGTITERTKLARKIYEDRMLRTCLRLPSHLGYSIMRAFTNTSETNLRLPQELMEHYIQQRRSTSTPNKTASEPLTIADFQDPATNSASSD